MIYKYLTLVERQQIALHLKQGYSLGFISKLIGKTKSCVWKEVKRLGRDNYCAELAQKISEEIQNKKRRAHPHSFGHEVMEKINNLQFQIDILCDHVKELNQRIDDNG